MFYCEICGRAFTRKFNLMRHWKIKHSSSNNGNGTKNIIVDEHNHNGIVNDHHKTDNNNDFGINNINDENKDNNVSPPSPFEINNIIQEFPDEKEGFDHRMLAATEAIKQKFDLLRNTSKGIHNFKNTIPNQQKEQEPFLNVVSKNNNTTRLEAKLPELLQCMLDILMIKELQNVDITDNVNEETTDGKNKNAKLKRRFNSVDEQETEDEITSPEKTPLKHLKYDYSMEHENINDNNLINTACNVKKYWHNPNTLVDELRNLMTTTTIGQQISTIIRRLNENNNIKIFNYFEYAEHKEDRNELIRNLNELKETNIGQQIFCILNELVNAEIIEPIDYMTDEDKHLNENDDEIGITDNDDDDVEKSVTTGEGLYIRPYKSLVRV